MTHIKCPECKKSKPSRKFGSQDICKTCVRDRAHRAAETRAAQSLAELRARAAAEAVEMQATGRDPVALYAELHRLRERLDHRQMDRSDAEGQIKHLLSEFSPCDKEPTPEEVARFGAVFARNIKDIQRRLGRYRITPEGDREPEHMEGHRLFITSSILAPPYRPKLPTQCPNSFCRRKFHTPGGDDYVCSKCDGRHICSPHCESLWDEEAKKISLKRAERSRQALGSDKPPEKWLETWMKRLGEPLVCPPRVPPKCYVCLQPALHPCPHGCGEKHFCSPLCEKHSQVHPWHSHHCRKLPLASA